MKRKEGDPVSYGPSGYYGPPAGGGDGFHLGSEQFGWPQPPLLGPPGEFAAMPVLVVVESMHPSVGGGGPDVGALLAQLAGAAGSLAALASAQGETLTKLAELAEQLRGLQQSVELLHGHLDEWRAQQGES